MTISELSDLDLSRLIAEEMEPSPDMNSKCWMLRWPMLATSGVFPENWRQPRNFVTDPAMRDLLQQKLLEEGWRVYVRKESSGVFWIALTHITAGQNESFDIECATRERLWAEVYALAKGLYEQ